MCKFDDGVVVLVVLSITHQIVQSSRWGSGGSDESLATTMVATRGGGV